MPAVMTLADAILLGAYFFVLAVLAMYGAHRWQLVWLERRRRHDGPPPPAPEQAAVPRVTVQLPVYNERWVVERLIDAACALRWPREALEIQVLDDSTDDSVEIAARAVARQRARGVDIVHLRRPSRTGYKAGALAWGLARAKGELVAIFDADFVPGPDFLERTVPHFADPGIGLVQARWGHLNRGLSTLTEAQAVLLDAHFTVEHVARSGSGLLFNFNGTAGVWRRRAIEDAGGWSADTLCEDLDLSYRAQLAGWRFRYLPEVVVEAELPVDMPAFKRQQHRWAKGSVQTCLKLLPTVLRAPLTLKQRREAFFHLTGNFAWLWMIVLTLLLPPAILARSAQGLADLLFVDAPFFVLGSLSVATFFMDAQRWTGRTLGARLLRLPAVLALGIGMAVTGARGVVEALVGHRSAFVRTPKVGAAGRRGLQAYRMRAGTQPVVELALSAWLGWGMVEAARRGLWGALPFLGLFLFGYLFVAVVSFVPALPASGPDVAAEAADGSGEAAPEASAASAASSSAFDAAAAANRSS